MIRKDPKKTTFAKISSLSYLFTITPVPLLLTDVRLHPPGRTDKILCRCFGAPATHARRPHGRVFPDHLIT